MERPPLRLLRQSTRHGNGSMHREILLVGIAARGLHLTARVKLVMLWLHHENVVRQHLPLRRQGEGFGEATRQPRHLHHILVRFVRPHHREAEGIVDAYASFVEIAARRLDLPTHIKSPRLRHHDNVVREHQCIQLHRKRLFLVPDPSQNMERPPLGFFCEPSCETNGLLYTQSLLIGISPRRSYSTTQIKITVFNDVDRHLRVTDIPGSQPLSQSPLHLRNTLTSDLHGTKQWETDVPVPINFALP